MKGTTRSRLALHIALLAGSLHPCGSATAQEGPGDKPKTEAGRYFAKPFDLWKAGLSYGPAPQSSEEGTSPPSRVALRETVWAQPIRTPDGTWMIYVPPKQILDFLESPSEETANAYIHWKEAQAQKLKKAVALLAQVKKSEAANPTSELQVPASSVPIPSLPQDHPFRITYFKRPSCPHCASQDAVLAEWLKRRPSETLDIVLPGERPELWKAYGVRATPTLVAQLGSGPQEVLVGLQSAAALDAVFAKLLLQKDGKPQSLQRETIR